MAIPQDLELEINNEFRVERIKRKRDQAFEMGSMAAGEGDARDANRLFEEAEAWSARLKELR